MLSRSIAVVVGSSLLLLPIAIYYLYRKRPALRGYEKPTSLAVEDAKLRVDETPTFRKENLTLEVANAFNLLLNAPDSNTHEHILTMIQQASAFSANYEVIKDSKCLESMLTLLECEEPTSMTNRKNLCILQTLANLVCNIPCLEMIKCDLDKISRIAFSIHYSDEACAALQVLCNVALTPIGCRLLDQHLPQLLTLLATSDPYILRQLFSVLVNLSCDSESCALILALEASEHLGDKITECLSPSAQPQVSLQLVNFLANLYKAIGSMPKSQASQSDQPTTREFLLNARVSVKLRLQFLLSEPSMADTDRELVQQTESLLHLLTNLKFHFVSV